MSRYFRLEVPKREVGDRIIEGGFDLIFDREHIKYVLVRDDGAAYVHVDVCDPQLVYKDEADRLIAWMEDQ